MPRFSHSVPREASAAAVHALILPLALFAITSHLLYRALLYLLVWALWLPKGKDVLFVYSDRASPDPASAASAPEQAPQSTLFGTIW